jgi:hypothetical protein
MSEHEDFLRQAALCVSMVATTDDPGHKAALLEMTHKWRDLAARAPHREKELPSPESAQDEEPRRLL